MAMTAIAVRCQWLDGSVSDTELPAGADPALSTVHDTRETAWAIQRAADSHGVRPEAG
jgi:hypothetical protein